MGGTRITARVVIHNQNEVGAAVIVNRGVKDDGCPSAGLHGYITGISVTVFSAVNLDRIRSADPVGLARKRRLVRGRHIDVVAAALCLGSLVIEGDAADEARSANLLGSVDLLRQRIVVE